MRLAIMAVIITVSTNVYAGKVLDFPKTVDGMLECSEIEKDLRGTDWGHRDFRLVGGDMAYRIRGKTQWFIADCGSPTQIINLPSARMAREYLDKIDPKIQIFEESELAVRNAEYQQQQKRRQELQDQLRQERLKKYGL